MSVTINISTSTVSNANSNANSNSNPTNPEIKEMDDQYNLVQNTLDNPEDIEKLQSTLRILHDLASKNHSKSQYKLGLYYEKNNDFEKSILLFEQAANNNDPAGAFALADFYDEKKKDMDKSIFWYKRAVELGSTSAMFNLGLMYSNGDVKPDPKLSAEYFKMAADKSEKDGEAAYKVGWAYQKGKGFVQNDKEALKYYELAIKRGYEDACIPTAKLLKKMGEGDRASTLFKELANKGNVEAAYILGHRHHNANSEELMYLKMAAKKEYEDSLSILIKNLKHSRNYKEAIEFCLTLPETSVDRWYELAHLYSSIEDNANIKDNAKIFECYSKLCNLGNHYSELQAGSLCQSLTIVDTNNIKVGTPKKAFAHYKKAVELGNHYAHYCLGQMYESGNGIPLDLEKALEIYIKGALAGSNDSKSRVERLCRANKLPPLSNKLFELMQQSLKLNIIEPYYYLGLMYKNGIQEALPKDEVKAFECFSKIIEYVNSVDNFNEIFADAAVELAICYFDGIGTKQDIKKAFDCLDINSNINVNNTGENKSNLEKTAINSIYTKKKPYLHYMQVYYTLGTLYEKLNNFQAAFQCYKDGSLMYHGEQRYINLLDKLNLALARFYNYGIGVKQDLNLAKQYYELAAARNDIGALVQLAQFYVRSVNDPAALKKAYQILQPLADKNMVEVEYSLGMMLLMGKYVKKDLDAAFQYLNRASQKGHALATFHLGVVFACKEFKNHDMKKAFDCYEAASKKNEIFAIFALAELYFNGNGCKKDLKKAHDLFLKIANENINANYYLALIYLKGCDGIPANQTEAFKRMQSVAVSTASGVTYATYELAKMYENGWGTPRNMAKAIVNYELAANAGHQAAAETLSKFNVKGTTNNPQQNLVLSIPKINIEELSIMNSQKTKLMLEATWRNMKVAVKKIEYITSNEKLNKDIRNRFYNEIQLLSQLRAPNIVNLYGYNDSTHLFMVFEYLGNLNLESFLLENPVIPLIKRLDLALQAAYAVAHIHQENIIHRMIDPANFWLTPGGQLKLSHFFFASKLTKEANIKSETLIGKDYLNAPEAVTGKIYSKSTDIYSFGKLLEFIFSEIDVKKERTLKKECPDRLKYLIKDCTQENKTQRPKNMDDIVKKLQSIRSEIELGPQIVFSYAPSASIGNAENTENAESGENTNSNAASSMDKLKNS